MPAAYPLEMAVHVVEVYLDLRRERRVQLHEPLMTRWHGVFAQTHRNIKHFDSVVRRGRWRIVSTHAELLQTLRLRVNQRSKRTLQCTLFDLAHVSPPTHTPHPLPTSMKTKRLIVISGASAVVVVVPMAPPLVCIPTDARCFRPFPRPLAAAAVIAVPP